MAIIKDVQTLGIAMAAWADRGDLGPDLLLEFIDFAGRSACQQLRVPAMERVVLLRPDDGRLAIPTDYLELRSIVGPASSRTKALEYVPWDYFVQESNKLSAGEPAIFTRRGNTWYIYPEPADDAVFSCNYYATFEPLGPETPTNWLLELSPMTYLFGGLRYLCEYTMDNERAAYWEQKFNQEIARIQALADRSEHRGSTLATRLID